jgi:penicillin amidase
MRLGKFFFLFFVLFLSCGKSTKVSYNLKAPVHVIIDRCGVPHIFAENEEDAFYVFGYIQAYMRLFQIDISRRGATGRTAEIFPSALSSDIMTRMLGFKKIAEISRESFANTGILKKISVFVEGINRYISDAKSGREFGGIRAEIPKQYQILGVEPQPFSVEDIIAMGKARSFDLSGGGLIDIVMKLIQLIYGDNFESKFSISPVEKISIVNDLGKTRMTFLSERERNLKGGNRNRIDVERVGKIGEKDIEVLISAISGKNIKNVLPNLALPYIFSGRGSNNFVVSGKITKHGYPILENDPHLATDSPSTFFPLQIKTPEYEVK